MAFEGLSEKLNAAFKKLRGKGRLTEADAHRLIEKRAMDTRRSRSEVAQELIEEMEEE